MGEPSCSIDERARKNYHEHTENARIMLKATYEYVQRLRGSYPPDSIRAPPLLPLEVTHPLSTLFQYSCCE